MDAMKLGNDLAETMTGAQRVVAARLPMMGMAITDPINADHRELGKMVTEKVAAFRTSGRSVESAGRAARAAATSNAKALGTLAGGGLLWPQDWLRLFETNVAAAAAIATLPAAALAPIHHGVVSNDKRLRGSNSGARRSVRPVQSTGR